MHLARYIIITYIDIATHKCNNIIKEQEVINLRGSWKVTERLWWQRVVWGENGIITVLVDEISKKKVKLEEDGKLDNSLQKYQKAVEGI